MERVNVLFHYHHTEKDVPVKGDVIEIAVLFALPSADEPGLRIPPVTHREAEILRRALSKDPRIRIVNVRGTGYKLIAE